MDASLLRINLLETFEGLLDTLRTFCTALRQENLPAWVARSDEEIDGRLDMRYKAVRLYQQLWYEDGQEGRETVTCPGLVGVSPDTLEQAHCCNAAKDAFKQAVLALKPLRKSQTDSLLAEIHHRHETVAAAMQRMGAARLNLKQAYRHVPLLDERPRKVGFTWSRQGRTIQRLDIPAVRRLLERRSETPQQRQALERLSRLPQTEILARIRPVCPHLRANILFADDSRRLVQTPLPLLVPLRPGEDLPEFVPVPPEPTGHSRLRRSDVRIEDEPFLALVQVHRYKPRYR
ncbi:MAG: hypothetical protein R3202_04470 [Candidatus Competibacterales bacterium]|nr:hypothetical protein [Candidatus Competibacterales bacterium]